MSGHLEVHELVVLARPIGPSDVKVKLFLEELLDKERLSNSPTPIYGDKFRLV